MSAPPEALALLRASFWADLTHAFDPELLHCPVFEPCTTRVLHEYATSGLLAHKHRHAGQWGPHIDPPVHLAPGARTLDAVAVQDMVLPLAVLGVHEQVATDPDGCLTLQDSTCWEDRNGLVPERSFVTPRTDWSHRWPSQQQTLNTGPDGVHHYPGWSLEVLRVLVEDRGVTAVGHETTHADPGTTGSAGGAPVQRWLLEQDRHQIDVPTHLDQVPECGGMVVVALPKPAGGSDFPARVLAICP